MERMVNGVDSVMRCCALSESLQLKILYPRYSSGSIMCIRYELERSTLLWIPVSAGWSRRQDISYHEQWFPVIRAF